MSVQSFFFFYFFFLFIFFEANGCMIMIETEKYNCMFIFSQ